MRIKDYTVNLPLTECMLRAYPIIESTHRYLTGKEAVITSGNDGLHKDGSKHFTDAAIDLRVWYTNGKGITSDWVKVLQAILGHDYDVVYGDSAHMDHIHIEYDPPI